MACVFPLPLPPLLALGWVSFSLPMFPRPVCISFTASVLFYTSPFWVCLNVLPCTGSPCGSHTLLQTHGTEGTYSVSVFQAIL